MVWWKFLNFPKDYKNAKKRKIGFALVLTNFWRFTTGRANLPFPGHPCNSGSLSKIGLSADDFRKSTKVHFTKLFHLFSADFTFLIFTLKLIFRQHNTKRYRPLRGPFSTSSCGGLLPLAKSIIANLRQFLVFSRNLSDFEKNPKKI